MLVVLNARFDTKVRVENCEPTTKIIFLKEAASKQMNNTPIEKMKIRKWWATLEDDKTLKYYRIVERCSLEGSKMEASAAALLSKKLVEAKYRTPSV